MTAGPSSPRGAIDLASCEGNRSGLQGEGDEQQRAGTEAGVRVPLEVPRE